MKSFLARLFSKRKNTPKIPIPLETPDPQLTALRESLEKHIAEGRLDEAIDCLIQAGVKDGLLLRNQYNQAKEHFDEKRISYETWSLVQARITAALLEYGK